MPDTVTIPDRPDFGSIKTELKYLQDVVMMNSTFHPGEVKTIVLEATIRIWRELNEIEKKFDEQVEKK